MKYKSFYLIDNGFNYGLFKLKVGGDTAKLVDDAHSSRKVNIVSNNSNNNGVESFIFNDNDGIKNCITIATRGNDYYACYQENYTITVVRTLLLYTNKFELNKYIGFYICALIRKNKYKSAYGRVLSGDRLKKEKILLPIDENENPNWQYIENTIKKIYEKINCKLNIKSIIDKKINCNVKKWKQFKISELFIIELSKGDLKINECIKGNVPLISSGDTNNGCVGFIDEEGDGKAQIYKENKITVDMFCKAYYQPKPFYAVSHGRVNILSPKFNMNPFMALFICSIINNERFRFSYGRAVYSNVISNLSIKLPAKNNEPDWEFMENYIKSLPYSANI